MLQYLHVKNLALIREAEIDFTKGLNILTGETGAGKSLLIGSVNLALGGKISRELIREGADHALVELAFSIERPEERKRLLELDIDLDDEQVVLSRKITDGKSINKLNGMTVTAGFLKEVAAVLLDLHGQHEHQSLLHKKKHLEILDEFAKDELGTLKQQLSAAYEEYRQLKEKLEASSMDESARKKEADFLAFEAGEIEEAALQPGEDEELEVLYQRMTNSKKITEALALVHRETGYEEQMSAGERIGRALRELSAVASYDQPLQELFSQLSTLDDLLNDFNRDVSDYLSETEFGEEEFWQTQERLNTINHLKTKYGKTIPQILQYQEKVQKRLSELENYDVFLQELEKQVQTARAQLHQLCEQVSAIRREKAAVLAGQIRSHLIDLNFLDVQFEIQLEQLNVFTSNGWDEAEFLISTNPGESVKPLSKVASGGELSRIMLAIKTVLADQDDVGTVIFDEIDVGISGRTAQKVSEKLALMGRSRQVICITHLAQIAAMADSHYVIEKQVYKGETRTGVRQLTQEESVQELARILGGAQITQTVLQSAWEMKILATGKKC